MTAVCDTRFLSRKLSNLPVYLNMKDEDDDDSCVMPISHPYNRGTTRSVTVSYTDCGTEIVVTFHQFIHIPFGAMPLQKL